MRQVERDTRAERERFTARLVAMGDPAVIEKLTEMSRGAGHSLAAEVRGALRFWIAAWEESS